MSYAQGPFAITAQGLYVSEGRMDLETPKTGVGEPGYDPGLIGSTDVPTVPSHFTMNLTGTYTLSSDAFDSTELFMTIDNVTDRDPKFSANGGVSIGGAYPVLYPALGRTYRIGARLSF